MSLVRKGKNGRMLYFIHKDEARIKLKSKDMRIRFFFFVYEQVLQLLWAILYKEELSFKAFVIARYEMSCKKRKALNLS